MRKYKTFKTHLHDSCSKLLITLHKLPIHASIKYNYKLSTLSSFVSDTASVYLSNLLHVYVLSIKTAPLFFWHKNFMHSICLWCYFVSTKTSGQHSFSYTATSVWNSLPHEIWHIRWFSQQVWLQKFEKCTTCIMTFPFI